MSLCFGLYWLAFFIFGLAVFYGVLGWLIGRIGNEIMRSGIKTLFMLVLVIILGIGTRLFVFEIYIIPSGSMEATLLPRDIIIINKLCYGPKSPEKFMDIPWSRLLMLFRKNAKSILREKRWGFHRFQGIREIQQGDVVVFKLSRSFFVKRCVATAGQTFELINSEVFTDGEVYRDPVSLKKRYCIKLTQERKASFFKLADSLGVTGLYPVYGSKNKYIGDLSSHQLEVFKQTLCVDTLCLAIADNLKKSKKLFANPSSSQWTKNRMGPFMVPQKGMTIPLTCYNIAVYKDVLKHYEKVAIKKIENGYFINGKEQKTYTFTQDYCFMMGDNRDNSYDSRYTGFIPLTNIAGRVQWVLLSNYGNTFHWNRFFKTVR